MKKRRQRNSNKTDRSHKPKRNVKKLSLEQKKVQRDGLFNKLNKLKSTLESGRKQQFRQGSVALKENAFGAKKSQALRDEIRDVLGVRWLPNDRDDEMEPNRGITSTQIEELVESYQRRENIVTMMMVEEMVESKIGPPPGRSFIHGTTAAGEILRSGQLWGGGADRKLRGEEERYDESEKALQDQERHFFLAWTNEGGVSSNAGNAFRQARKDARNRIDQNNPLDSWRSARRPLVAILEFSPQVIDQLSLSLIQASEHLDEGFFKVATEQVEEKGPSLIDYRNDERYSWLRPSALRLVNLGDLVRLIDYLKEGELELRDVLPKEIRTLANSNWDGTDLDTFLSDAGDFRRLTNAGRDDWITYQTEDIINFLEAYSLTLNTL